MIEANLQQIEQLVHKIEGQLKQVINIVTREECSPGLQQLVALQQIEVMQGWSLAFVDSVFRERLISLNVPRR